MMLLETPLYASFRSPSKVRFIHLYTTALRMPSGKCSPTKTLPRKIIPSGRMPQLLMADLQAITKLHQRPGNSNVDNASRGCFRGQAFCSRPLKQSHGALCAFDHYVMQNAHNIVHKVQHNIVHKVQHNIVHKVQHNIVHKVQHNIVHKVQHNIVHKVQPNIVHEVQHNIVHKVQHNIVHEMQHNIVHKGATQHCFQGVAGRQIILRTIGQQLKLLKYAYTLQIYT